MGTVAHGQVEFLDLLVDAPGRDALADPVGQARPRKGPVALTLIAVAAVLVAARALGAPPAVAPATAVEAPVFASQVALPTGFGVPVQLATAPAAGEDVVWVLGDSGRIARVADGVVTAASAARGYHAIAARPDGRAVYVSTGRLAPTVVALDPVSLDPGAVAYAGAPVTAITADTGSVWAGSAAGVQGWSLDLRRPLRALALPPEVGAVRSLAVVGSRLQAVVTTTSGVDALLRLDPAGGDPRLTSAFGGPVSVVPGVPALVAHVGLGGSVEVVVDPSEPGTAGFARPLPLDASIWPGLEVGSASWLVSTRTSASLDCFDASGQLVGRTAVGDTGLGVLGPVTTTSRAVYAVTVGGHLARGGHASCGVAPRASTGGRRGD